MVRVVAQRVRSASVAVDGVMTGAIGRGLALLVGIEESDDEDAVSRIAAKVAVLRVFEDSAGRMNLSTGEAGGSMLVISQFTLFADVRKGRRPSFIRAARPDKGKRLYELFASLLVSHGYAVARGVFGAHMLVSLENDGPVTIILDSAEL